MKRDTLNYWLPFSHLADGATEVQRDNVAWPKSHAHSRKYDSCLLSMMEALVHHTSILKWTE